MTELTLAKTSTFGLDNFITSKDLVPFFHKKMRNRVFNPFNTLKIFMHQVMSRGSCKCALAKLNAMRLSESEQMVSMNSAAYTKAKARLPLGSLIELVKNKGKEIAKNGHSWKWKGHSIYLGDGFILSLEDTESNRMEFPASLKGDVNQGLPKLRFMGLFDSITGTFIDGEIGKYCGKEQSEITLLKKMVPRIEKGSILILDRYFTNFFLQGLLINSDLNYVIRARDEFAKKTLGESNDKIVTMAKPRGKNDLYDVENAAEKITVRVIRGSIDRPGFRPVVIYIITSLIDKKKYSKADIEKLYLGRWNVELDIRNLKTTLEASNLRSKGPTMAIKETFVHLLTYNFIRFIILCTALSRPGKSYTPRKYSFKTTLLCCLEVIGKVKGNALEILIKMLSKEILNAKYRREARAIKKRNNKYPLLTTSREEAKYQNWGYSRRKASNKAQNAIQSEPCFLS